MAKITNLRRWKNGETFNARDYVYERELVQNAINEYEDRIKDLEQFQQNFDTTVVEDYLNKTTTGSQTVAGPVEFQQQVTASGLRLGEGLFSWNDIEGTVDLNYGDVSLQLGQEQHFYGKQSQTQINNGEPIAFAGVEAQGNHFILTQFLPATMSTTPEIFIGVATQTFPSETNFGYVTEFGFVRDFDTDTLVDAPEVGKVIWLNPNYDGDTNPYFYTTTAPERGQLAIRVAVILKVNQNINQLGMIFVRPTILENFGGIQTYLQNTEPENFLEGDLWFDTGGE